VLTPRGSLLSFLFGGSPGGVNGFRAELAEALADDEVSAILIDVDSPGGVVSTIPETAAEIRAARGAKPIVAVANTMCASAALWLAAQADELIITPSGVAGSVGALMVHEDWSRANEAAGIELTYVAAGRFKAEGNPDEPLGDEARAEWQTWVDDVYAVFVADLAAGRGVSAAHVGERFGEGRVLRPTAAVAAKMCDRVATIDDTVAALSAPSRRARAPRAVEDAPAPTAFSVEEYRERLGMDPAEPASYEPASYKKPAVEPAAHDDEPEVEVESDPVDPGPPAKSRPLDPAAARMAAMRAFRA
jgi:signal peptide peptidase SppA